MMIEEIKGGKNVKVRCVACTELKYVMDIDMAANITCTDVI